jgi:hypothetical protein
VHPPADLDTAPQVGKLAARRDVGGSRQLEVVEADQRAVTGGMEVELDRVGTQPEGQPVGAGSVLGSVPGGSAVRDHERFGHGFRLHGRGDTTVTRRPTGHAESAT